MTEFDSNQPLERSEFLLIAIQQAIDEHSGAAQRSSLTSCTAWLRRERVCPDIKACFNAIDALKRSASLKPSRQSSMDLANRAPAIAAAAEGETLFIPA